MFNRKYRYKWFILPTALKSLKRDFGNPVVVSDFKVKLTLDKPQIKGNNHTVLRQFQQELKCNNSWLISMGYHSTLASSDHVTKAIQRLPHYFRQKFYKYSLSVLEVDKTISLLQFEVWLEKKLKLYYNPIANIIANREKRSQKNTCIQHHY